MWPYCTGHIAYLPTAVDLDLIAHRRFLKAVIRHVQDLERRVLRKHASEGLGSSSAHGAVGNIELQAGSEKTVRTAKIRKLKKEKKRREKEDLQM
jgi:hypothetical protein